MDSLCVTQMVSPTYFSHWNALPQIIIWRKDWQAHSSRAWGPWPHSLLFWVHGTIIYHDRSVWWRPVHLMTIRKQRGKGRTGQGPTIPVKNVFPVTYVPPIRPFLFPPKGKTKLLTQKPWRTFISPKQYQVFGYKGAFRFLWNYSGVCEGT